MGLLRKVRTFILNVFRKTAAKEFDVKMPSEVMEKHQQIWADIIAGKPMWANEELTSINFAKFICQFVAKKTCLDLDVRIEGSTRADYINKCIDEMVESVMRDKVEDALAFGGIILKPTGSYNPTNAINYVLPSNYVITEADSNGNIRGIIFIDKRTTNESNTKTYYTRLEYHHFDGDKYIIENKAYKSKTTSALGDKIELATYPDWANVKDVLVLDNMEQPMFAYFKMPSNNTIDFESAEGVSIFSNVIEELKNLDIAWARKSAEVEDSTHITFIDEAALGRKDKQGNRIGAKNMPRFVQGIRRGVDSASSIDEHVATLLTDQRITDINSILSMISTKAGFSQGQFVLDRKSGQITATQIESDDRETIETITDVRNALKKAIKGLVYALDKAVDVYIGMESGYINALDEEVPDEDIYYFKDLLSTFEQDRARAFQLLTMGVYSKKKYLTEYEGFSEEEAQQMLDEAKAEAGGLFGN